MKGFDEQLRCRKVILEEVSQNQPVRWGAIISGTIAATGSSTKSQRALDWLRKKRYIKRATRGVYEITPKGTWSFVLSSGVSTLASRVVGSSAMVSLVLSMSLFSLASIAAICLAAAARDA